MNDKKGAVLIVGGGIAGIQASLDLADAGFKVYLVEKSPSIGGIMSQHLLRHVSKELRISQQ